MWPISSLSPHSRMYNSVINQTVGSLKLTLNIYLHIIQWLFELINGLDFPMCLISALHHITMQHVAVGFSPKKQIIILEMIRFQWDLFSLAGMFCMPVNLIMCCVIFTKKVCFFDFIQTICLAVELETLHLEADTSTNNWLNGSSCTEMALPLVHIVYLHLWQSQSICTITSFDNINSITFLGQRHVTR